MLDPFVARTIRDLPADVISLKVGINLVNGDTMRDRTFAPALHGFLDTVREGHPDTPILVVSPIICPPAETHPGPTIPGADGRFHTMAGLEDLRLTCLTLTKIRATIAGLVLDRAAQGDRNLHHLDGLELFGPDDVADLPDDLHPNAAGYVRMGERFAELAFGPGRPLA
jgi:lysophospholipase L1-like esterase